MQSTDYSHGAYRLVVEPHVEIAIWAIIIALGCILVVVIDEMVKRRNAPPTSQRESWWKKPKRRR
jgi:hypothetical protein